MKRTLEICCGDIDSVIAAYEGGADRIELCSALEIGGLTPSAALIDYALHNISFDDQRRLPVHVLIRPRPGDFVYDDEDMEIILRDIAYVKDLGADGVVVGMLNVDGTINMKAMKLIMEAARPMSVTFHRAFDLCSDPDRAIVEIAQLGCDRILTSGCMPSAEQGIANLRHFNEIAAGRVLLMAGSGVNEGNAKKILDLTGLHEIHASARQVVNSAMRFKREDVSMGASGNDEYSRKSTSSVLVKNIKQSITQP